VCFWYVCFFVRCCDLKERSKVQTFGKSRRWESGEHWRLETLLAGRQSAVCLLAMKDSLLLLLLLCTWFESIVI